MRGEFNRASGGRGSTTPRGSFQRAAAGSNLPFSTLAKITRTADTVRARVERHHESNRENWTNKRFGELLKKSPNTLTLTPRGIENDPKQRLMTQAQSLVATKRSQRLARVDRAKSNMLESGKIRASRKVDWGKGLAD